MKILVVGSDKIEALENSYVQYIREMGAEVAVFPAQTQFHAYYNKSILNKLTYRLGISGVLRRINQQLKERIGALTPDVIWVFKGMEVFPSTLYWAKERGIRLANYNPDNPFLFSGRGSGNKNVTNSIGLFDLHFTYNQGVKEEFERRFSMPVADLPFGFDIPEAVYQQAVSEKEVLKLCFLGNPDEIRASFITKMAESGLPIDVYGNNWKRFLRHENIQIFDSVYGVDFWKVLRRYRVQLNLMRPHNPDSHNMRTFEVPGIGGIMLAPLTKEHALFFEADKEVFFYRSLPEAADKARQLIDMSHEEAEVIRAAARERSLESGYSYRDRSALVYDRMIQLLKAPL
ncbi:MAG: glycosyltransferase family 1 protein [Chitinophagaceae bacterium]|nr:glycosyltransferase family 1 protein [Chitinophagaceae bacterium]